MYGYGIDLGTTYSCIARADENGNVEVIKNIEGKNITPSVVEFESAANIVVGETAKGNAELNPDNVVMYVKRAMGKQPGDPEYLDFEFEGEKYLAEQISSYIIKKLVKDAEALTGDKIEDVVITVPAYFGFDERKATENAGKIAGVNVLALVNEPTAAAIAYGAGKAKEDKVVLVYDLGGGTFDVTVVEIVGDKVTVMSTDGNHSLGGKDWDAELMAYLITQFCEETGVDADEIYEDPESLSEMVLKTESAKMKLTSSSAASTSLSLGKGKKAKMDITMEKFTEITKPLLASTVELVRSAIEQAAAKTSSKGKTCDNFDEIILVGGSTRMRQVEEMVQKEFGMTAHSFDPDEAVAKGAAFLAVDLAKAKLKGGGDIEIAKEIGQSRLGEVSSKSYGIRSRIDGEPMLCHIILKNDSIPTSATDYFSTIADNQSSVEMAVFESNLMERVVALEFGTPLWDESLGIPVLELPPGLPAGTELEVTFTLDLNGLLQVSAVENTSGKKCNFSIKTKGLSEEKVMELSRKTSEVKVTEDARPGLSSANNND